MTGRAGGAARGRTLLTLGHGYVAEALAADLLRRGWHVIGTTRSAAKAASLQGRGIEPLVWPGSPLAPGLARASHVLVSVPAGPDGDPAAAALATDSGEARPWLGYISTTGVYGDAAGGWVDEDSPLAPGTERGRARVAAEAAWRAHAADRVQRLAVFRLPGIYGPGRSAFDRLRDGTAQRIVKPGQVFSRIHVDDIAAAVAAAMDGARAGTWNLADDAPAPPQDVIAHAARLMGRAPPPEIPFAAAALSPMARSFYSESKRVSNARMKRELLPALRHPTYHEGLEAILAAGG